MDIRTTGLGIVGSAAASLLSCGTKGKRCIAPNTSIMVHGAFDSIEGNHEQLVSRMRWMQHEQERDIRFWLEHSKYKTREAVLQNLLTAVDIWMTAEEAVNHGIIDYISQPAKISKKKKR
jgi:ATP-dependent Clp protease protease subunit